MWGAGSRSTSRLAFAAAAIVVCCACGSENVTVATPPPTTSSTASSPSASPTPAIERIDIAAVMKHVRVLSEQIGLRNSGSAADKRASLYLAGQIERLGWTVQRRPFPLPQGGESWNVVGSSPGFDERKPYVIVGGHYDSLNGPGGNDNATGPAIALEVARALAAKPGRLPMVFVGFGAEERQPVAVVHSLVGSRWFVAHMSDAARKNLVAMVNIDMVGRGDPLYCPHLSTGPTEGAKRCVDLAASLGIPAKERVTPDWSDNGTFLLRGMNAAWVWSGDDPCCMHTPKDTFDHVVPADVQRAGTLTLAIVRSYTG